MLEFYCKAQLRWISAHMRKIMNYELKWDYMDIGMFHYSKMAKFIPWIVISCWPSEWVY